MELGRSSVAGSWRLHLELAADCGRTQKLSAASAAVGPTFDGDCVKRCKSPLVRRVEYPGLSADKSSFGETLNRDGFGYD